MILNNSSCFINSANDCLHDTVAYDKARDKERVGNLERSRGFHFCHACLCSAALIINCVGELGNQYGTGSSAPSAFLLSSV